MDNSAGGSIKPAHAKRYGSWFKILIIGLVLYIAAILAFIFTGNPNLFPTVVLVGNFLVPVAFVSFFYERRDRFSVNMSSTSLSFLYGGILGTIVASLLEPFFISYLTFGSSFIVGLIEELAKIIGVVLIARRRMYNSEMDGIVLGAAAGMGFAAFESTGYAFTFFIKSGGSLSETVFITLVRGLASPVGHGTWTAILSAVLLKESYQGRFNINHRVAGAYLAVAALHGLWDGLPFVIRYILPVAHSVLIGQLLIGAIGLTALYIKWRGAKRGAYAQ